MVLVAGLATPVFGQIAPLHWERRPMVFETYRQALGRDPTPQEMFYWILYPDEPAGLVNANSLFHVLLVTLRNSAEEREATARRALTSAFEAEEAGNPRLREYVEDRRNLPLRQAIAALRAEREGGGYRGLVAWLSRPDVRQRFIQQTGMAPLIAADPAHP